MKKKKKVAMAQQSYSLNKIINESIDYLIQNNFTFVIFKNPFDQNVQLIVDAPTQTDKHFVLKSFDSKETVDIRGPHYTNEDISKVLLLKNEKVLEVIPQEESLYMSQTQYEQYVTDIKNDIKHGKISKCVAARKKKITLPENFSIGEAYNDLRCRYGAAFTYVANTKLGLWMGASPELLLFKKENRYFTVALAGTKLAKKKRPWTAKEIDEHKIVVDYITDVIEEQGFEVFEKSPVFDGGSAHLLHLKMDINFYADKSIHDALHPTPAVCGIPVQTAKEIILANEGANRSLYSGYLGLHGKDARYFVNLRCMQLFQGYADIYIGAGITEDSVPEDEWNETEAKSQVMAKMILKQAKFP